MKAAYSKAVLSGLRKYGVSAERIRQITGLSQATIELILVEKATMEDRHLAMIEQAVGLTAGQLAVLSDSASGDALVSLMADWAKTVDNTTQEQGKRRRKNRVSA